MEWQDTDNWELTDAEESGGGEEVVDFEGKRERVEIKWD